MVFVCRMYPVQEHDCIAIGSGMSVAVMQSRIAEWAAAQAA